MKTKLPSLSLAPRALSLEPCALSLAPRALSLPLSLVPCALCLFFCLLGSCTKDNLPEGLEWSVPDNPSPLPLMNDKVALVYEVMVKNSSIDTYTFESVSVKDGSASLLELTGTSLTDIVSVYHSSLKTLGAGETAFLYLWVEVSPDLVLPESLTQIVQFNRTSDGKIYQKPLTISIDKKSPAVLAYPLSARRYAAVGAPSNNSYHRRTVNFLDSKFWTSDRYAMDFIGLDDGNRYRQGRQDANIDYFGYQDIVYSATAGVVVSVIDTIAENIPPKFPEIDPSALFRSGGNQLVVKVSEGTYVFYGNLTKASSTLKAGDKVEVGQPIGRLGNSGNCDAPQLHLQVMDGPDPLRSHGIPWVFNNFTLHGNITGYNHVDGLIKVTYLTIQKSISGKNIAGDAVVNFD